MMYRQRLTAIAAIILATGNVAFAGGCAVTGPRYLLSGDTVTWSMRLAGGRSCTHGVRYANVEFEDVGIASMPRFGRVALLGSSFKFEAKDDYRGDDQFTLTVSGKIRKVQGTSTIRALCIGDSGRHATGETPQRVCPRGVRQR
jgi:hypothetical protein